MNEDVILRDYEPRDVPQITSLMQEIYDPEIMANSRRHWHWQYHENPRNPDGRVAIRVVERGDEIVAMICGIRQNFSLGGTVVPGLWVVDFMARQAGTNQKERHRYGQRLALELKATQPLVAGVNRPALNRYWKRVLGGQIDICACPMMIRPLRAGALARQRIGNPLLATLAGTLGRVALPMMYRARHPDVPVGLAFEPVTRFDASFDAFWARASTGFSHLTVRDAAYLNWRYLDIPDREYSAFVARQDGEIRGWVVLREIRADGLRKGRIVDLLAPRDDEVMWHYLLAEAVDRCREAGCDLVHALGSTVEPLMRAFAACGFRANPEHSRLAQYIAYTSVDGIDLDEFYDGDNWYVTLGDSDTDFATPH